MKEAAISVLARPLTRFVLTLALVPTNSVAQTIPLRAGRQVGSALIVNALKGTRADEDAGRCTEGRAASVTDPVRERAGTIPFAGLSSRLKRGEAVSLLDDDGGCTEGKVVDLTPSSLTLLVNKRERRTFPEANVRRIAVRDSLWNGAIIGFAVGLIPAGTVAFFKCPPPDLEKPVSRDCSGAATSAFVVVAGLFTAMGAGIDAVHERTLNVSPQGARLKVSPVLSPDRQAVLVSIRF